MTGITPARTIYPGNYITTFDGLKYIIPFGKLRLRMSGPTAGRLIPSEIGEQFTSSSLPMLHIRTINSDKEQSDFEAEFRPGVEDNTENIDLTDEFERQFFGDLMLFTVDRLAKNGVAIEEFNKTNLSETFELIEQELLELYENKHQNVQQKSDKLSHIINNEKFWWNQHETLNESIRQLQQFIKNMQHNFDEQSPVYQHIQSKQHQQNRID